MLTYGNILPPPRNQTVVDENDSWEVKAFAEDMGSSMGTTWPPRFYSCSFCHREFRSAQALGGHMNVHRRDRARINLLNNQPPSPAPALSVRQGDWFFYTPSIHGSSSSFPMVSTINFATQSCTYEDSCHEKVGSLRIGSESCKEDEEHMAKELDLELRLGW